MWVAAAGLSVAGVAGCTTPDCDGTAACNGVESPRRSCISFCASEWDFSAPAGSQVCAPDACDEDVVSDPLLASSLRVCPADSRCTLDAGTGRGVCLPAEGLLSACRLPLAPDEADPCGEGLACQQATGPDACPNIAAAFPRSEPPGEAICYPPAREGQECDSNLVDREVFDPVTGWTRVGCRPCEEGTWCVPAPWSRTAGSRCVRPCANDAGAADPSLCGCGEATCSSFDAAPIRPATGERLPFHWCRPCLRSNTVGCAMEAGVLNCCDGDASCHPPVGLTPMEPGQLVCCRAAGETPGTGDACDPGARFPQCCEDSFCSSQTNRCEPCATDGEAPGATGCCPGLAVFGALTNAPICRRCTDVRGVLDVRAGETRAYCGDEGFAVYDAGRGRLDAAFVPDSDVRYSQLFEGLAGGFLYQTGGVTDTVEYDLGEEVRAYLLEGDVRSGIPARSTYVELPRDDLAPGTVTSIPTRLASADSFLLHDLGDCSARVPYTALADVLSIGLHQGLAAEDALRGLRNNGGVTLEPILSGREGEAYGLLRPTDRIAMTARYQADGISECGAHDIEITASLAAELTPGYVVTDRTRAADAVIATASDCGTVISGVRCEVPAPSDTVYTCFLPRLDGAGVASLERVSFPRRSGF